MPTYGFNLGNSLEATWGVPNWTTAIFSSAASAGFNAVRIPCAWDFNADHTTYKIDPAYMSQVKQAVDAAIAAGLYVVINDHWDDGWLENNIGTTVDPVINAKMNSYWTQIATEFAGYDNHLLFAGANEPNIASPAAMNTLMIYYQTFINAVRATGGNNINRWLVLQSISDPSWMNTLPTDSTPGRLMVEYHQYTPSLFTIFHTDQTWGNAMYFWGAAYHYSGDASRNASWGEEGAIDSFFQQLTDEYVSKGIPVMIGEFGAYTASSLTGTEATYNLDSTLYWDKYVAESARGHGLSPFYWSTPDSPFTWSTGAVTNAQFISVLMGGVAPLPNGAPDAVSNLAATNTDKGQISLSWAASSNASSYKLYRAAESGFESSIAPLLTGITGTNYTDTGLNDGTTYYYQIVAVNSSGVSGFSTEAHATTPGVNPDPANYNFETDPQGWTAGSGLITGVVISSAQHYAGNQSLAVNFNGTAGGTSDVYLSNVTVLAGATITFHVWVPGGSKVTGINLNLQDYNWNSSSTNYASFTSDVWNTITLTVPANDTTPLQRLDIQFTTSAAWIGTLYIDSIE